MIKTSATDESLEQAFFQLAYDKLQSSLKNLLPFLIGFEIVKKNEDSTKALGVFGFRSQSGQILYVPAFFINGKIKNLDLLYSKNNEQFYPLNEDFAELFLKDDVVDFGTLSNENRNNVMRDTQQGDYRQMTVPPRTGKYSIASVIDYVKDGDNKTKQAFKGLLEKDAEFCEAVLRFYPLEKVAEAVVETEDGTKYKKKGDKIKVVTKKDKEGVTNLSKAQREDLLTQGYVVVDERKSEEKSKFGVVDYVKKFQNPSESGFYPYITKAGTINYGLILVRPKQLQQGFATDDAVVVDLDASEKGTAHVVDVKHVLVKDQIRVEDYSQIHKMMVDPAEVKPGYKAVYVLVNENLKASQPFRVNANFKDANGIRRISVETWECYDHYAGGPDYKGPTDRPGSVHGLPRGNFYDHPKKKREILLVMTKKPGDEFSYEGCCTVYVPSGYKLLELKLDDSGYNGAIAAQSESRDSKEAKAKERYLKSKPGCVSDLNAFLNDKNVFPMTVRTNGSEYFLDIAGAKKSYDNPIKAKIAMVTEVGLDYKEACELIDGLVTDKTVSGHLKKAYTGDVSPTPYEEQPYTNEIGQPTYVGVGQESRAPGDESYSGNPSQLGLGTMPEIHGIDPNYVHQAIQMAQNGQKEIFDVQSMATLAKYVGVNDKITEYLPSLVEGMDRLGRILFLLHWDTEKFVDMYGRNDLPELVELVTNVFKNIGDLIIFLKRKSPELSINMTKDDALDV